MSLTAQNVVDINALIDVKIKESEFRARNAIDESIKKSHDEVGASQMAQMDSIIQKAREDMEKVKMEMNEKFDTVDKFVTDKSRELGVVMAQAQALKDATERALEQLKQIDQGIKETDTRVEGRDGRLREMINSTRAEMTASRADMTAEVVTANEKLDTLIKGTRSEFHMYITQLEERIRSSLAQQGFGSSPPAASSPKKAKSIVDSRDYHLDTLEKDVTLEGFKHWRHKAEQFLQAHETWKGASHMLDVVRRHPREIVFADWNEMIRKANDTAGEDVVNGSLWDYHTHSQELYQMLSLKLNLDLFTRFSQVGTSNGFELWRQINKDRDPMKKDAHFFLRLEIRNMAAQRGKAANFEETYALFTAMEAKAKNYQAVVGSPIEPATMVEVMWIGMDAETTEKLEKLEGNYKEYSTLRNWLVEQHEKMIGQWLPVKAGRSSNKMDTSAILPGSNSQQRQGEEPQDPWGAGTDPWSGQWLCTPCTGETSSYDLDAMGKGGKKPLDCWNCLGQGHPSRLCPSQPGAGEKRQSPQCPTCKGHGHTKEQCTSVGGGAHVQQAGKGKGKNKGKEGGKWGGSKGSWKGKGWSKGKGISELSANEQYQYQQYQHQPEAWVQQTQQQQQPQAPIPPWMASVAGPQQQADWPSAGGGGDWAVAAMQQQQQQPQQQHIPAPWAAAPTVKPPGFASLSSPNPPRAMSSLGMAVAKKMPSEAAPSVACSKLSAERHDRVIVGEDGNILRPTLDIADCMILKLKVPKVRKGKINKDLCNGIFKKGMANNADHDMGSFMKSSQFQKFVQENVLDSKAQNHVIPSVQHNLPQEATPVESNTVVEADTLIPLEVISRICHLKNSSYARSDISTHLIIGKSAHSSIAENGLNKMETHYFPPIPGKEEERQPKKSAKERRDRKKLKLKSQKFLAPVDDNDEGDDYLRSDPSVWFAAQTNYGKFHRMELDLVTRELIENSSLGYEWAFAQLRDWDDIEFEAKMAEEVAYEKKEPDTLENTTTARSETGKEDSWSRLKLLLQEKLDKMQATGKVPSVSEVVEAIAEDIRVNAVHSERLTSSATNVQNGPRSFPSNSGSTSAWLAGADDDSQRSRRQDDHATGHSSMSKPRALTHVDDQGGRPDPSLAPEWLHGAMPMIGGSLSLLGGLSSLPQSSTWQEIEITVDSGACETVMPMSLCQGISVLASKQYLEGVEYEVANGATIPNLGERRCLMMTQGSQTCKKICFQIADVHKPLLSISKVADLGFDCLLGKNGGYLIDTLTGEKIPLDRRDNLYVLKAWVKQDPSDTAPFHGPV